MQKRLNKYLSVLAVILPVFLYTGCSSQAVGSSNVVSVKTAAADKHKLQTALNVTGILVPTQTVNVAAKAGGQVKSISVIVGSNVKAGDNVIVLETKELNAQLQQAEAALNSTQDAASQAKVRMDAAEKTLISTKALVNDQTNQIKLKLDNAKISLDAAKKTLDRTKQLFDAQAISQSQLDDAQRAYDLAKSQYDIVQSDSGSSIQNQLVSAQSNYDIAKKQYESANGPALGQAEAAINSIKVQLDNANIASPISGTVINKNINQGEIASPGVALLTISDTSVLKLKGTMKQEMIPLLQVGEKIDVIVDIYPDKVLGGKIESIGPMAVSTGEYFPIEISISNPGEIKAGLSAHASLNITSDKEEMIVPASAVVQNSGQSCVFVIKNNVAVKRVVTVGLKNEKEVEILKGLDAGEKVAITNVNSLFDNMQVSAN